MSRSLILGKLHQALSDPSRVSLPCEGPEFPRFDNPVRHFQEELESVGGVFLDGRKSDRIADLLTDVLKTVGTTEIFWETQDIFDQHPIPCRLRDAKAFSSGRLVFSKHRQHRVDLPIVMQSKLYSRNLLASIELSASCADWGIAETGTVIHRCKAPGGRLLSVFPPAHLTFLSAKRLLMNSTEFFRKSILGGEGSASTLVTGPSQTADIEKTLVRGVHGPKMWFVMLTDEAADKDRDVESGR